MNYIIDPNDPTEKLNAARNPGLVKFANFIGMDYLKVGFAIVHSGGPNKQWIDKLRTTIERKFSENQE